MASQEQKPRDMFRWAFEEQWRSRIDETFGRGIDKESIDQKTAIEAGAMDAFDYVWRRYGLDNLLISPGYDHSK